jgi:GNAT superfamily N-acetyltransferase
VNKISSFFLKELAKLVSLDLQTATRDDVEDISCLILGNLDDVSCPEDRKKTYQQANSPQSLAKNHFERGDAKVLIAKQRETIVGVLVYNLKGGFLRIRKFHVLSEVRRNGVATKLIELAIQDAKTRNMNLVLSKVIPENREVVEGVMEKAGITITKKKVKNGKARAIQIFGCI